MGLRPASAQSDQDPCCSLTKSITSRETGSEQHGSWSDCSGWSGSMIVTNPLWWFCHDAAYSIIIYRGKMEMLISYILMYGLHYLHGAAALCHKLANLLLYLLVWHYCWTWIHLYYRSCLFKVNICLNFSEILDILRNEPCNDKTNIVPLQPAWFQTSLCICTVWSGSMLFTYQPYYK
jgi:hypothetical protein